MKRLMSVALAALALVPVPVAAQEVELRPPVAVGGLNLVVGVPVGEFKDYIEAGFGLNANIVWPVQQRSPLALRGDIGFLVYGSETKRVCFSSTVGCRIELDLTTTNSIFFANVGPQLMVPTGRVRPYVNAGVGLGYFFTTSDVSGTQNDDDFASTTNHDDATFAWSTGGGLLIQLSSGRTPVALDLGARYHSNGSVEYLKSGDIEDHPDGSISIHPTRSEANLMTINLGVSIGFRPGLN